MATRERELVAWPKKFQGEKREVRKFSLITLFAVVYKFKLWPSLT